MLLEVGLDIAQPSERFEKGTKAVSAINLKAKSLVVLKERDRSLSGPIRDVRHFR